MALQGVASFRLLSHSFILLCTTPRIELLALEGGAVPAYKRTGMGEQPQLDL